MTRSPALEDHPIFILGMLQRTGTNHLSDLFELHPDVVAMRPIFEDHLVRWSPHLAAYVDDVSRCWTEDWDVPDGEAANLMRSLGDGILDWIRAHDDSRRIVTKMPSLESVEHFDDLFPDSPLVMLVRDGRAVVESGVRSFGWSYERAMRRWNAGAEKALELRDRFADRPGFAVTRYEDLVSDPGGEMRRLCAVVGLDPARYEAESTETLPVRGSSSVRHESDADAVHWEPVEKDETFTPLARWESWSPAIHRRFAEVAGPRQTALGYDLRSTDDAATPIDRAREQLALADVRWRELRVKIGRARRAVRRVHGRV